MDIQQKRLIGAKILGGITLILMLISQPRYEISIDIIGFTLIVLSGGGRIWSSAYIAGLKSKRVISYGPYFQFIGGKPLLITFFLPFFLKGFHKGSLGSLNFPGSNFLITTLTFRKVFHHFLAIKFNDYPVDFLITWKGRRENLTSSIIWGIGHFLGRTYYWEEESSQGISFSQKSYSTLT